MNNSAVLMDYYYPCLTSDEIAKIRSNSNGQAKSLYWRSIRNIFKGNELEKIDNEMQNSLPQNLDEVLMEITGDSSPPSQRLKNEVIASNRNRFMDRLHSLKDIKSYFTHLNTFLAVYYKNC